MGYNPTVVRVRLRVRVRVRVTLPEPAAPEPEREARSAPLRSRSARYWRFCCAVSSTHTMVSSLAGISSAEITSPLIRVRGSRLG